MEGDAGTRQLNPTDADTAPDDAPARPQESLAVSTDEQAEPTTEPTDNPVDTRRASRLGVGWVASIFAVLLLLAAAGVVGGYLALRSHADSEAMARAEAAALQAAKDCVAATHAPDSAAMTAAQAKIIECSTGDFGVQAALYSSVLVDAYKAANVTVQMSDMRAAVERHNDDGTIDVLVAARVKVTNSDVADQEQGYRLRVKMASDQGVYKVARLDQVTS
jgi:Mce-associated membrane protein